MGRRDGHQAGDVYMGSQKTFDVITGTGMATGKKWHLRL